jgi:hypothetical protein
VILENGRGRNTPRPSAPPLPRAKTQPPPVPPARPRVSQQVRAELDEDGHSAQTMIINVGQGRGRG